MSELSFEEYKRQVEEQSQALLEAMQSVALGDLDVEIEVPEGAEVLSDLAVALGIMVDHLRYMMAQQVQADLVEKQSRALLEVIQSVALGDLDIEVQVPEGVEVLSELAIGVEMMVDDLQEMMAEQEQARAEIEAGRQKLEEALQEVLSVQRRYLQQEWQDYTTDQRTVGYSRIGQAEGPTADAWLPGMTAAVRQTQPVTDGHSAEEATLAIPIRLYDKVIGAFGFSREGDQPWSPEELAAAEAIVEQVGWALESQRLFDEEQQARSLLTMRVNELDCLNDIGRRLDQLPPVPELLQWITERVPEAMSYPDLCVVSIELDDHVYGVTKTPTLPRHMVQSLLVGAQPVGRITIAYTQEREFLDEESALLGDIARRVSGYVENQRLIQEIQGRASELAILNDLSRILTARLDVDQVLRETYRGVSRLLDTTNFYIGLHQLETNQVEFLLNISESALEREIMTIPADTGITGYIVRTRESVLIKNNVSGWLAEQGIPQVGETASCWLGVPLLIGDQVLGVMAVQNYVTPNLYDEHDLDLMTAIASQAAIAIQNARLFEETQAALNETATLYRIAKGLSQMESRQEMFELVLTEYLHTLGLPQGGVMTLDPDGEQATLHALMQNGRLVEAGMRLPVKDNPPTERALATQEPVAITDVYNHELTAPTMDLVAQLGYKSLLLVPIIVRGEAVGLLGADAVDEVHEFTEREIDLVRAVADQLGIALENQRLIEQTRSALAETEALYQVARSVSAFESLPETLQAIANSVAEALPADRVGLYTLDLNGQRVTHFVRGGPGADHIDEVGFDELQQGLSGWVLHQRQPALSPKDALDPRESPEAQQRRAEQGSGSLIVVPIQYRDRVMGTLTAINHVDQPDFAEHDVNLLRVMANQTAAAVENARLFEEAQTRAEEQTILNQVGQALTAGQDVDSVLREAYRGVSRLLGTDNFYVALYDEELGEATLALQVVEGEIDMPRTIQPVGRGGLTDYLVQRREPLLLPDRVTERVEELGIAQLALTPGRTLACWLGVPIMLGARVLGTMVVLDYTTPRAFDARSQDLLSALANQTALALENVRLLAETRTALAEVEATQQSYLRRAWQDHLRQREMLSRSGFVYDRTEAGHDQAWAAQPELWRPEMEQVMHTGAPATALGVETPGDDDEQRAGLAIPISIRGQTIGILGVETPSGDHLWTEEDVALIQAVGEQLGQTLETARLFADTQRRAERERLIGEITSKIRASTDMRDILETAATELGQALGTSRAAVRVELQDLESQRQAQQ